MWSVCAWFSVTGIQLLEHVLSRLTVSDDPSVEIDLSTTKEQTSWLHNGQYTTMTSVSDVTATPTPVIVTSIVSRRTSTLAEYDNPYYDTLNYFRSHLFENRSDYFRFGVDERHSGTWNLSGVERRGLEDDQLNLWTLWLLVFPALTVFGNILVVMGVYRERSLQTATNYFIVSLAIADIMVAILVMPLAVYVEVSTTVN